MKHLTINTALTKLMPSKFRGGCPLSLKRLYCFKAKSRKQTAQDSAIREDSGRSHGTLTNLGLF